MRMMMAIQVLIAIFCGLKWTDNYCQEVLDKKQEVLDRKISLRLEEVTFKRVLKEIEKEAEVKFVYSRNHIDMTGAVTIEVSDRSLREVLSELFTPRRIRYLMEEDDYIILTTRRETEKKLLPVEVPTPAPIVITVNGKIISGVDQEPLPGANVIIKGTLKGTSTDKDGKYTIDANDGDVLVFSFVGFESYETPIEGRTIIDVKLRSMVLEEVVVNAGYWKIRERERTGNISKITLEDIQKQPVSNPLAALEGRMAGVYIQQETGVPGGSFTIQIRGQNSLRNEGNYPLYVIDGVPFTATPLSSSTAGGSIIPSANPLNSINPADIESVEVLKDADATSVYGSRGANGVMLITTKRGKAGRTKVDVNVYSGVGKVTRTMDLLSTPQYIEMRKEAFANSGIKPGPTNARDLILWSDSRYTDWQKTLIGGTAHITNGQASVSAGNEHTTFLVGGGFYRESTVFPGDFADRKVSSHFNLSHSSDNKKFKAVITANYVADDNNLLMEDLTSAAITLPPNAPAIYTEDGKLNWENLTWNNPFSKLRSHYDGHTSNLIANGNLSYEPMPGLLFKTSIGYNTIQLKELSTIPISSFNPAINVTTGASIFANNSIKSWIVEPQAEYQRNISNGTLSLLAGATLQRNMQENQTMFASGFTSDALLEDIDAATDVSVEDANTSQYRYAAVFARIHYKWNEKYFINLTGRRDGSSRFGSGKQFANFGAVGAAWIFSSEEFMQAALPFISFAKLRASYGTTGSDLIGDYQYLDTYSASTFPYQGDAGLLPTRLYNPDFAWESNRKCEAALALGFIQNRILVTGSWYNNRSSNQLIGYPLPAITGKSLIQYNSTAAVKNTGWEFELNTLIIKNDNVTWTSSVNVTIPRNTLTAYPDIKASMYQNTLAVGQPLSVLKGYRATGVDPQTGIYTFQDVNEDGSISDPEDWQILKNVGLDFYGGFQNSIEYRGFQLDMFFQFVKQTGWNYLYDFSNPPGTMNNQPVAVMARWQKPGDETDIQRFTVAGEANLAYRNASSYSDYAIGDASFVRLKNLSLSYKLPLKWSSKSGLQSSRIYIQGQNLATITRYKGMDPENKNANVLPPLRILTMGLQLTL